MLPPVTSAVKAILTILSVTLFIGCKPQTMQEAVGSLSSVAIKVPDQVMQMGENDPRKAITSARLTGNSRTFLQKVEAGQKGHILTFTVDTSNEGLKVGDSLGRPTLTLINASGKAVYEGRSTQRSFVIAAGENRVSFELACQDARLCPTGGTYNVIGVAVEPGMAPSILADISIKQPTGFTEGEKRSVLTKCQEQIRKRTCSQWGADFSEGQETCSKILAAKPTSVCAGKGTFTNCLEDYLLLCQKLGVVQYNKP